MISAVFISDLHLHPEMPTITERFYAFINWAIVHARSVYILGDFFHVWPGDDALDVWSEGIAQKLAVFSEHQIPVYLMAGNRDFLLGKRFARLARIQILKEPAVVECGGQRVLLVHGDRYCLRDKRHQWLRRVTRNGWFPKFFLRIPKTIRFKLVNQVRAQSQKGRYHPEDARFDVVLKAMLEEMRLLSARVLIHGHTHKPGLTLHDHRGEPYSQFVLSDWDDTPLLLCYDRSKGFYFELLPVRDVYDKNN